MSLLSSDLSKVQVVSAYLPSLSVSTVMGSHKMRSVTLIAAYREELFRVSSTGVHAASVIRRTRVLFALDSSLGEVDLKEVIVFSGRCLA